MSWFLASMILPALLLACSDSSSAGPGVPFQVVRVHDGDTVRGPLGGQSRSVRLLGMDAPELGQGRWGAVARDHLKELLGRGPVRLQQEATDRYGRSLAWLWIRDGAKWTLVNAQMVEGGYAYAYVLSDGKRYGARMQAAEQQARTAGVNIWARSGGLRERPSDWRKQHR
jgi:micrococcal nuclease